LAKTISTNQIHPKKKNLCLLQMDFQLSAFGGVGVGVGIGVEVEAKLMDAPKQVGHLSSRRFQKEGFLRSRPSGCVRVSADLRICVSVCLRCLCVCASVCPYLWSASV